MRSTQCFSTQRDEHAASARAQHARDDKVVDLQRLLAQHGLIELDPRRIYDGQRQIGRVQSFCGNLKALCSMGHGNCTMFLSVSNRGLSQNRASAVLYRWLADGRVMSRQEHQSFARELKTQLGMNTGRR